MAKLNIPLEELHGKKDFNSRVCLEVYRGNKWSEFVCVDAAGPRIERIESRDLERRFKTTLDMPVERIALSFLRLQRSAFEPQENITTLLLEVYIMAKTQNQPLRKLAIAELLKIHNELATTLGKPTLKAFKESKAKLVVKIEALKDAAKKPTKAQAAAAETKAAKKPAVEGARPKLGIGAFCMGLLKKGESNAEVLAEVKKKFPDASTSAASVAWYRNKLKDM